MISLGSIIGSGWLLGTLTAAKVAGGASIVSWIMGGAVLAVLALVHAELGSTYPVSGGTARFPFMAFGALGGFTGGWMAWLQAVTIAPIEVEATLGYLNSQFTGLNLINGNGTLDGKGILIGAGFMLVFAVINTMGVRWLAKTNSIAVYWKVLVPLITIGALVFSVFHFSNFTAGGRFAPYGFHGMFAALPLGIVFALEGFEQAIQVGGEAENPQRNIPRAVIISMIIGTLIYLLLEVAFVGALNPANLVHGWANPISGVKAFGPYATLATTAASAGCPRCSSSTRSSHRPGTGLVYIGTSSRLSYGLGKNGYFPRVISAISRRGVPFVSICIAFVVGLLTFLPFPSWAGLVGLVTSATVIMYAMAPVSLAGLRREDPDRPRGYRLPAAGFFCPLAFVCADLIVYFAGFSTIFWLYVLIAIGFIAFAAYQAVPPGGEPDDHRLPGGGVDHTLAGRPHPHLLAGPVQRRAPTVFGVTLLATMRPAELVGPLYRRRIQPGDLLLGRAQHPVARQGPAAVEDVEAEASVELDTPLT